MQIISLKDIKKEATTKAIWFGIVSMFAISSLVSLLWFMNTKNNFFQNNKYYSDQAIDRLDRLFDSFSEIINTNRPLLSLNCAQAEEKLKLISASYIEIHSLNLVKNNTIYCSSVTSKISQTLSTPAIKIKFLKTIKDVPNLSPFIFYHNVQNGEGVLIVTYTDQIKNLLPGPSVNSNGKYILKINHQYLYDGRIYDHFPKLTDVFRVNSASKKYSFSIFNIHTQSDLSQFFKKHLATLIIFILFALIKSLLIAWFTYSFIEHKNSHAIKKALNTGEIMPFIQPIADARTGQWTGGEVLIRWKDKATESFISPELFIPIAEKSNLIVPITTMLIQNTAKVLSSLEQYLTDEFKVSFNISTNNCKNMTLLEDCEKFLLAFNDQTKIKLALEITEREFLDNKPFTVNLFEKLRDIGVEFALDDFGTKNSNLAYFDIFKIDYLKIDQSFSAKLAHSDVTQKILDNIFDLSKKLNLPVVVEGIETVEQKDYFISNNIHCQQGYLFSKPIDLETFKEKIIAMNKGEAL